MIKMPMVMRVFGCCLTCGINRLGHFLLLHKVPKKYMKTSLTSSSFCPFDSNFPRIQIIVCGIVDTAKFARIFQRIQNLYFHIFCRISWYTFAAGM